MQAIFYRENQIAGAGRVEDVLCFSSGVGQLSRACAPGTAHAKADQAVFFGGAASVAHKLDDQRFEALASKLQTTPCH